MKTLDYGSVEDTHLGILVSWWRIGSVKDEMKERYNLDDKDFLHKFEFWGFVSQTVRLHKNTPEFC